MKRENDKSDFWDNYSKDFDAIYTHEKPKYQNLIDEIFRKDMYERFQYTMAHSQPVLNKRILDVGCGSGYYSLAFARQGAMRVIGIDYSEKMIELAKRRLKEEQLQGNCEFHVSDIMNYKTDLKFDISIAIGLFDYIEDPRPVLRIMRDLTREKMILTFPRMYTWRAPIRKIRLLKKNLDVYFYSSRMLKDIFSSLDLTDMHIEKVGKLHCVEVKLK